MKNQADVSLQTPLQVTSKIPGCMSGNATTKTILITNPKKDLSMILYQGENGAKDEHEFDVAGIINTDIIKKIWCFTDKIFPRSPHGNYLTVSYNIQYCPSVFSFLPLILHTAGYKEKYPYMQAHHCNGNPFDNRVQNGLYLSNAMHTRFHAGAKKAAAQGYDVFISYVKSFNNPQLLEKYANSDRRVLFYAGDKDWLQENVALQFFGSTERFDRSCKAVLEKTNGQTEKEIHFDLTL